MCCHRWSTPYPRRGMHDTQSARHSPTRDSTHVRPAAHTSSTAHAPVHHSAANIHVHPFKGCNDSSASPTSVSALETKEMLSTRTGGRSATRSHFGNRAFNSPNTTSRATTQPQAADTHVTSGGGQSTAISTTQGRPRAQGQGAKRPELPVLSTSLLLRLGDFA